MIDERLIEKEALEKEFMNRDNLVEICFDRYPNIHMIDPMNMRSVSDNMIYHESTLQIGNEEFIFKADDFGVITKYSDSIWKVKSIFLPLKIKDYKKSEVFNYKSDKIEIHWLVKDILINSNGVTKLVLE